MPALFEGGSRSYYFADNLFSDRFTGILKCDVAQCISLISNAVHRSGTIDVEAVQVSYSEVSSVHSH
jgi:hypothetical protein